MEPMNPLLFKAHPLLQRSVELVVGTAGHRLGEYVTLLSIYLLLNVVAAVCLKGMVDKLEGQSLPWRRANVLALPALLYAPFMITVLSDVVKQEFRLVDRLIPVVILVVLSQMLTAWFGLVLRYRNGQPLGLSQGFALALGLLLVSIPCSLLLLGLDSAFGLFG
ncbi:MAG: hypothetical protein FIA97_18810 [Methylococcaceae bacterium]|nr:hypothetical protein [Methylococcaceae bacterium]